MKSDKKTLRRGALAFINEHGGLYEAVMAHQGGDRKETVNICPHNPWLNTSFVREVCEHLDRTIMLAAAGLVELTPSDQFVLDMMIEHLIHWHPLEKG